MKIGAVAKLAGMSVEAIRFYEKQGLINIPSRNDSGYRIYSPTIVNQLFFITRAKELGFSLKEIKELLFLQNSPKSTCAEIKKQTQKKIEDIEGKIAQLKRIKKSLIQVADSCPGVGTTERCPILKKLTLT